MSITNHVDTNHSNDKLFSPLKNKSAEKPQSEQKSQIQQSSTGLEWSAQAAAAQQFAPQVASADPKIAQNKINTQSKSSSKQYEIKAPGAEDIAILSTSVAIKEESVVAVMQKGISSFLRGGFNMAALEESYRETFKKSKSHNLLLERFMSNVKFSAMKGLCSLLGISAEEQDKIQKEVREKALSEIDSRRKNEWAYSRAMLEIVG